tara:strand:+ start:403 stop:888 length:486 start_codon:yes stop_codon:yes gene_type:complete
MKEIKVYQYPHQKDNIELETEIFNSIDLGLDVYPESIDRCHMARWSQPPQVIQRFVDWLEETTDSELESIWGVWYLDGGGIEWHSHASEDNIRYSFSYYIKVPEDSSSLYFSEDPSKDEDTILPVEQGICAVWDNDLPHCVPPSNHEGRCVLAGNLKWKLQ